MPVIRTIPNDPTDLVIQGEQFREKALSLPAGGLCPLVAGEQQFGMMPSGIMPTARLQSQANGGQVRNNAFISTPCGALIPVFLGQHLMKDFVGASDQWAITGVTRDSSGVALGSCRVVALEIGRVQIDGAPVVGETISDGSGNYTLLVPLNTAYWLIAYKPGSPDVGGVSLNTIVPVAV